MWALSSARLERRSYMTNRRVWRSSRLTGGRRFKSARAHFFSILLTFSLFFATILFPYIILTSFSFSPSPKAKFVINCINDKCANGSNLGFREEEIKHLIDVKNFLIPIKILFFIFLFFSFLLFPFYKINQKLLTSLTFLFFLFFLLVIFNFQKSFLIFHKIFFKSDFEFPSHYNLIQLYPEKFFVYSFAFSSLFSLLLLFFLIFFHYIKS